MLLEQRISSVSSRLAAAARAAGRDPEEITLCAATKTQTDETIRAAIEAGISVCGENRVQELCAHLEADAYAGARQVHFIGHLQTNKVNKVVGRVELIHSVDSLHLLEAIDKQAAKLGLVQDILVQVNLAAEQSKGGVLPEELESLVRAAARMEHVGLRGLMAIPPAGLTPEENGDYFEKMHRLFVDIKTKMADNKNNKVDQLSMGMSGDFEQAIAHGATLVRVGAALFGPRPAPAEANV